MAAQEQIKSRILSTIIRCWHSPQRSNEEVMSFCGAHLKLLGCESSEDFFELAYDAHLNSLPITTEQHKDSDRFKRFLKSLGPPD